MIQDTAILTQNSGEELKRRPHYTGPEFSSQHLSGDSTICNPSSRDSSAPSALCRCWVYVIHMHTCRQDTHRHKTRVTFFLMLERKGNWVTRRHQANTHLSSHFGWLFSTKLSRLLDMWPNIYGHLWQKNRSFDIQKPAHGVLSNFACNRQK